MKPSIPINNASTICFKLQQGLNYFLGVSSATFVYLSTRMRHAHSLKPLQTAAAHIQNHIYYKINGIWK